MRIMFINKAPRKYLQYDLEKVEKLLNSYASPGTKIEVHFPDDFPGAQVTGALHAQLAGNCFDHFLDTPAIIRKVVWAQDNGYDAVIQSNTFDPGIEGSRYVGKIPVLGPFRTTIHIVATMADRIGIMVPLASHVPYAWKLIRLAGMENHVTDVRAVHMYGDDLADRKPELLEASVKVITGLKDDGAQACMPMGGLLIPYIVSPEELEQRCGIQVYNMKAVTIRVAEMCVALGIRQCPLTYPQANLTYADFI